MTTGNVYEGDRIAIMRDTTKSYTSTVIVALDGLFVDV